MKHLTLIKAALFVLLFSSTAGAAEWKPASGPLKTRWAKDVTPDKALPEYPRPQLVRKEWQNLNGLWDISAEGSPSETPVPANTNLLSVITAPWQGKILVPFAMESALSGVMKHTDRMTYRRSFEIPKDWSGRHVLLHFGAVDWEAKVTLNGRALGVHRGGYDPFSFDITAALKADGAQDLAVEVFDPTNNNGYPRGKQTLTPGSIKYTPSSGIWQTVWLEPVAESHIDSLQLVPDLEGGCLRLTVVGSGTVEAVASDGGKEVARVSGAAGSELKLAVSNPKLWSPDSPHLYDLSVSLKSGGKTVDEVTSYFGMRKIALGKDGKGLTRLMLNNKVVFQVGPLDQGFWPDGIYTAPTDEALRFDIAETKRLGFNTTRKHVKVEPDRWYYWCDKLGLMVWQDMPCSNSYTDKPQPIDKPQFKTELVRMVTKFWNHPSIIMWVVFNENQGQHDTEALVAAVKELDPSRLVSNASGNDDKNCGDVIDKHTYPSPDSPKPEENRAAVLGEFGGLGLPVDGHTWSKKTWGYEGTKNVEDLTRGYEKLLVKAWEQHVAVGLSAVIYTQLTDVETECNGLLTYDREVNKVIPERAVAANTGKLPPAKQEQKKE
ncbi:MAG: glycoside hydrolase family 2 TIM barrel-domain containing protein [bacterium]